MKTQTHLLTPGDHRRDIWSRAFSMPQRRRQRSSYPKNIYMYILYILRKYLTRSLACPLTRLLQPYMQYYDVVKNFPSSSSVLLAETGKRFTVGAHRYHSMNAALHTFSRICDVLALFKLSLF